MMPSDAELEEEEDEEDDGDDVENSGSHVNDALNQRDAMGGVLVNVGHPASETDIFLAPQLAAIVKPHQVTTRHHRHRHRHHHHHHICTQFHKCHPPLPSARQHPSHGDCLEVKREYYQSCSVLGCVTQCSQSAAHSCEQFLQVQQIGLSHWDPYTIHRGGCLELYYCNMVEWSWWDSSLI